MTIIKIKPGCRTQHMNDEKPYLGYRIGHGMPSARTPQESYNDNGRKNHRDVFGKNDEWFDKRPQESCVNNSCPALSTRKQSGCVIYRDISKCDSSVVQL